MHVADWNYKDSFCNVERTQARIAIMTLAGNNLSFSDARQACKRCADEFLRDPKEHDAHKSHTVCVSQAKEARIPAEEQEGDTDVKTALAALNEDNDTELEETNVQEILLAYKESRQLRGEQRVNRGYRPVTGRTSGGKPYRVEGRLNIKELISRARGRICREKGHWARECPNKGKQVPRDGEEANTSFFVYFGGDHSTPCCVGKGVIDTGCSRFYIGQKNIENMGTDAHKEVGLNTQKIKLEKAMTFGNDTGNQDCGHTPCWNCWWQWSTACARGAWRNSALVVKRFFSKDLGSSICSLRNWECEL